MKNYKTRIRADKRRTTFQSATLAILLAALVVFTQATAARAADGDLDATFNAAVDNGSVNKIVVQTDGKIVIGGTFTIVGGAARGGVARLNADGSLDASFNPGAGATGGSASVPAIAVQSDGKVLVGGSFTTFSGTARSNIARLNADGTLDSTFTASAGSIVQDIVVQPGGNILVGGYFSTFNGTARQRIAQLQPDGTLVSAFSTPFNNPIAQNNVTRIALQPDGKILINGFFDVYDGTNRRFNLARLNANGSVDATFVSPTNSVVSSTNGAGDIVLQTDGRVLASTSNDAAGYGLKRFSATGQNEAAFPNSTGAASGNNVPAIYLQPGGKIVIGGTFTNVGGANRNFAARLNSDGTLDAGFNPNANSAVFDIAAQPDGKILIGGSFTTVGGTARTRVARLVNAATAAARKSVLDFDGDGKSDFVVARAADAVSQTYWLINNGADLANYKSVPFGTGVRGFGFTPPADIAMPEDYDGDGKTDIAVFRPTGYGDSSRSYFFILQSSGNTFRAEQFGASGDNPTVSRDYDNDGKADIAVYRDGATAGAQSYWFYRPSATAGVEFRSVPWGSGGDFVAPGDYDGDGKGDFCVYRNAGNNAGQFILNRSSDNGVEYVNYGLATDQINPGDYDGDGKTDFMLTRNVNGSLVWYLLTRAGATSGVYFGVGTDFTVQGDYDGDGKTDIAVWRRNDGTFYVLRSNGNSFQSFKWGQAGDYPVGYYNAH